MKKTATLDRIHGAPEAHISKSNLPKLTYNQALDLVVTLPGGAIRTVRSCSPDEMRALVETCARTSTKKGCVAAVKGLDYREPLDKWYAILELVLHGCVLPLATAKNAV